MPELWAVSLLACTWGRFVGVFGCPVCGLGYLVDLPFGTCWFLYRTVAPFPMFIGEVLSGFCFLWEPRLLVFLSFLVVCGALPFWK